VSQDRAAATPSGVTSTPLAWRWTKPRPSSAESCAALACSDDPRELVRVAFEHWNNIGWPEDNGPLALLERAPKKSRKAA